MILLLNAWTKKQMVSFQCFKNSNSIVGFEISSAKSWFIFIPICFVSFERIEFAASWMQLKYYRFSILTCCKFSYISPLLPVSSLKNYALKLHKKKDVAGSILGGVNLSTLWQPSSFYVWKASFDCYETECKHEAKNISLTHSLFIYIYVFILRVERLKQISVVFGARHNRK